MPNDASLVPSEQHKYADLTTLDEARLYVRRESVFLVFAGLFLGTLAMLNILGISRFIKLGEITLGEGTPDPLTLVFAVAVGVLPYPVTFLCTDFISELYGRKRASRVVWVGLLLNLWVVFILWVGGILPGFESFEQATGRPPLPEWNAELGQYEETGWTFFQIRYLAFGAVTASMIAYLAAQLVDVYVFHFWKKLTKGKHLWLRNNGSTLVSQLVDTTAVILITYTLTKFAGIIDPDGSVAFQLLVLIATGYVFKLAIALIDTVPFMLGAPAMARYLRLPPPTTHHVE